MKRSATNDSVLPILPKEIIQLIIVEAHHEVSYINTVCKDWQSYIKNYKDWFSLAQHHYIRKFHIVIDQIFKMINSTLCLRTMRFANYIGFLLDAKWKNLCFTQPTPIIDSIYRYIKTNAQNLLTFENYHPRDIYLDFTDEGHLYTLVTRDEKTGKPVIHRTVKPDDEQYEDTGILPNIAFYREYISVTGWLGCLFPKFNKERAVDLMIGSAKWSNPSENAYFGMTREEIYDQWDEIREIASRDGSAMHHNLEMYFSGQPYKSDSKEFQLFKEFEAAEVTGKLIPYRTEMMLYSTTLRLCGSVDILWERIDLPKRPDGKKRLIMGDYKRSKKIEMMNQWDESGIVPCTAKASSCNFVKYSFQEGQYTQILDEYHEEAEQDFVIEEWWIIVLHPNQTKYQLYRIPFELMKPTLDDIRQFRLEVIKEAVEYTAISL